MTHILEMVNKLENIFLSSFDKLEAVKKETNSPYRDQYHSEYEIFAKQGHDQAVNVCIICSQYMVFFSGSQQNSFQDGKQEVNGAGEDRDKLTEREFCMAKTTTKSEFRKREREKIINLIMFSR